MQKPLSQVGCLALLERLIENWEDETVEFKQAPKDYDTAKIGKYFSALSNEANLEGADSGWLVFGVQNKTRTVVGTDYRTEPERLNGLKQQILSGSEPGMTFRSVNVVNHPNGRVILFEVPTAPPGMPVSWVGTTTPVLARASSRLG